MELGQSVLPPIAGHTHTVVFLHGRGDTGRALAETFFWSLDSHRRSLKDVFPSVRWVFPQSELRHCERLDESGSQWFDIWNTLDFTDREELQAPGLRESVLSVRRVVLKEAERVGGLERVVLGGISQGGATAVHSLLNLCVPDPAGRASRDDAMDMDVDMDEGGGEQGKVPTRLAAFVGFACRLPFPGGTLEETRDVLSLEGTPSDEALRHTPVFLGHCANDPLVFIEYGKVLRNSLLEFGADVTWREYEDGGHWINSPKGVDDVVEFLVAQGLPAERPPNASTESVSMSPD